MRERGRACANECPSLIVPVLTTGLAIMVVVIAELVGDRVVNVILSMIIV